MLYHDIVTSTQEVADNAQDVRVNREACLKAAKDIKNQMILKKYSTETWSQHPLNPIVSSDMTTCKGKLVLSPEQAVDWIFTIDLLNFSFWSDATDQSQRFTVSFNGECYTGYWSLVAAINRALSNGIPITTPEYWISPEFSKDTLAQIFASETAEQVPLLEERYGVLVEAGRTLQKMKCESLCKVIDTAGHSAQRLLETVTSNFASFNDTSEYTNKNGTRHEVAIYKRAQILVADLWACFQNKGYGQFDDIDTLTMFADYRVPQILYSLGCIEYSPRLTEHICAERNIEHNTQWEIELRACSIYAVELMRPICETNAVLIDFYLWDTAKEQEDSARIPCHRTRSIYY